MGTLYKDGIPSTIKTITTITCSQCGNDIEHESCVECHKRLVDVKEFKCFGNFHRCNTCQYELERLVCPKCKNNYKKIERMGIDVDKEHKAIVYTCLTCKRVWTSKPFKRQQW